MRLHQVITNNSQIHITLEDHFGEGDKTAVRASARFTSAATGKTATFPVHVITHWAGDKITEAWEIDGVPMQQP